MSFPVSLSRFRWLTFASTDVVECGERSFCLLVSLFINFYLQNQRFSHGKTEHLLTSCPLSLVRAAVKSPWFLSNDSATLRRTGQLTRSKLAILLRFRPGVAHMRCQIKSFGEQTGTSYSWNVDLQAGTSL